MNARIDRSGLAPLALVAALCLAGPGCGGNDVTAPQNHPPRLQEVVARPSAVILGGSLRVTLLGGDPDGDPVQIRWRADAGSYADSTTDGTIWTAPMTPGTYTLTVEISDGEFTVDGSVTVRVGNAVLVVDSDPPGANITLDLQPTSFVTPHTFDPLPPGGHPVRVSENAFIYEQNPTSVTLVHGRVDTVTFSTRKSDFEILNLGRDDFLEIGGVAWLPTGFGMVYSARTAEGSGIFTSALNPRTGTPNGLRLLTGVKVNEPVALSGDGKWLFYVTDAGNIYSVAVADRDNDGRIDSVGTPSEQVFSGYGPATAVALPRLAYASTPSEEPSAIQIFWSEFADGITDGPRFATTFRGKLPAFRPDGSAIAFVKDGALLTIPIFTEGTALADTLADDDGAYTAPAWGGWGNQPVATLWGPAGEPPNDLRLTVTGSPVTVSVFDPPRAPAFMAWSPAQPALALSANPGGKGEILLVFNLPIAGL